MGEGETDVRQKKQTAATDSMEGLSPPSRSLRDDRRAGGDAHSPTPAPVLT